MDEDMARILGGTDESSQSLLRRVSNAVRHGRTASDTSLTARQSGHGRSVSETTRSAQSPRWPRTPIAELDSSAGAREISSPISYTLPFQSTIQHYFEDNYEIRNKESLSLSGSLLPRRI